MPNSSNINRIFANLFLVGICLISKAQNWTTIPNGKPNYVLDRVLLDSIHNELIVSGNFSKIGNLNARGVARWNGVKWDTLTGGINTHTKGVDVQPNGKLMDCTSFNGKLLVGGIFESIGGVVTSALATWDGIKWDTLPKHAFRKYTNPIVYGLYKKGGLVYIYGTFDSIAGQPTNNIATWNGSFYQPVSPPLNTIFQIRDVKEYKNELYICGGFYDNADTISHIMRFNGTNWHSVGGGIKGNADQLYCMTIYNNELYVGGTFKQSHGNIGENIMKWDGTQWIDVGFGGEQVGSVRKMIVHNNKLWAVGDFVTAAYMPAWGISVYDGTKWCILQDSTNNILTGIAEYNDSLYISGGFTAIQGDTNFKYLAKLKNETLVKQCNAVGIKEFSASSTRISIYPNPTHESIYIKLDNEAEIKSCEVIDPLGRGVLKTGAMNTINLTPLPPGYYTLIVRSNEKTYTSKLLKD